MKVQVYYIGKTQEEYLREGHRVYTDRLRHYLPVAFGIIPDIKKAGKLPPAELRKREGERLLAQLSPGDHLVLLDEGGKQLTSMDFATWIDKKLQQSAHRLVFVVGGAYGFDDAVRRRADATLSLSKMTFSHQMVRLFFAEQLYRAMSILRGEKYHNP